MLRCKVSEALGASGLRKEMRAAASTRVLPPQLGRELGLPTSQSTVSALWPYTRVVGQSILSLSPTPSQPVQLWWPLRRKGWHLYGTQTRCHLQSRTGKRGPEKAVGKAGGERTLFPRRGNSHFRNYRRDLSQAVIYWAATLFQTQSSVRHNPMAHCNPPARLHS